MEEKCTEKELKAAGIETVAYKRAESVIGPSGNRYPVSCLEENNMGKDLTDPRRVTIVRHFQLSKTTVNAMSDQEVNNLYAQMEGVPLPNMPHGTKLIMPDDRPPLFFELKGRKFDIGSGGCIALIDMMGNDYAVVQAARTSYGEGTKSVSDDRTLIRHLMRHNHGTPFEMAELKFFVQVPMDTWRQWIRHRTANVNEYSTRYSEAIDEMAVTLPGEWRLQSGSNKQGSDGFLAENRSHRIPDNPEEIDGIELSADEIQFHEDAKRVYQKRLRAGIAREQARKDLPLSTYTRAYWKCDLRNILHFLGLRMDSHAQKEIRDFANVMGEEIIKPLFPQTWEAFFDYELHGMKLSRLDIEMIGILTYGMRNTPGFDEYDRQETFKEACGTYDMFRNLGWNKERSRERDECRAKLEALGILSKT